MHVTFVGANPRERARPLLDHVLENGVDQIAIACAFLTGGGVELLKRHARRLRQADSFVVVAWEWPTDLAAVQDLDSFASGNVYVHLGVQTPVEKYVGPGLMHSKIFFARTGDNCWLWTGSHNLTANAAQGVNCEAAILLEGTVDERPFQLALAHLNQCKHEAVLFDPYNPPPEQPAQQTLVIHAECHVSLSAPPWYVHLRPATSDYDRAMRPPGSVWLYLYRPGSLQPRAPRPAPFAAYAGTLTALNFTQHHPQRGIPADWTGADFVIEQTAGVPRLKEPTPNSRTPTQGVFRVDSEETPTVVWLTENPKPRRERVVGETRVESVDSDFRQYFTPRSLTGGKLIHREYRELRTVYRVARKEIGDVDAESLVPRLPQTNNASIEVRELGNKDDKFAFIYRAKFRL
jgi:hypothetical protein